MRAQTMQEAPTCQMKISLGCFRSLWQHVMSRKHRRKRALQYGVTCTKTDKIKARTARHNLPAVPSDLLTRLVLTEPQASPAAADKSSTCSTGACCCQPVRLFPFDRTAFNLRRVGTARLTARKIGAAGCAASISRHQAGNCTIHRHLWPPSLLFRLPHLLPRTHTSMAIAHAVFLSPAPFFACIIPCASVSFSLSLSLSLSRSLARSLWGARARSRAETVLSARKTCGACIIIKTRSGIVVIGRTTEQN